MKSPESQKQEGNLRGALWAVALAGAVLNLSAPLVFSLSKVVSTGIGSALAVANLWAISWLARRFLGGGAGFGWAPLGALKILSLFLVLYVLLKHHLVEILPLAFGYLALPIGVVLSQLRDGSQVQEEN